MSDGFMSKVIGAASQGAVGAFVGASLSAVTEPVVNEVLVKRKPVMIAISEHSWEKIVKFFQTTVSTNFIKFPFFEVVNLIMNSFDVPATLRGTVTGMVFTTATLPITNYRFRKSMGWAIGGAGDLYQAYLPTVGRDVMYGIARNKMMAWVLASDPKLMATPAGRAKAMFATVIFSCVVSAPGNEYRGYVLQPKDKRKPFFEFFDPVKTARSTTIGGLIMATSLAVGAFSTPFVESFVSKLKEAAKKDPLGAFLLLLFVVDRLMASRKPAIEAKGKSA
jgi:hypothetical protein|mmetsp:Transcript_62991/g.99999  ORF Transcript_62991/g.99999 Transcript_62991/m.99999 type:complete len:278 (-) Transcript_62991:39-872(-)